MISRRAFLRAFLNKLVSRREHVVNFSSSILLKVISFSLYFAAIPFFISHQGIGEYGIVAFIITVLGYSILLDNGITYIINLRYAQALSLGERDPEKIVRSGFPVYIIISVFLLVGGIYYSENISNSVWGSSEHGDAVAYLSFALAVQVIGSIFSCVLLAHNKVGLVNGGRLVADVIRVSGLFVGAISDEPVLVAVLMFGLGSLCKVMVDIYNCSRVIGLGKLSLQWSIKDMTHVIKASPTMWMISLLSLTALMYDKWYVSSVLSPVDYSYYSVANDFCVKAYFLFYAFSGAVYTPLIKKYAANISVDIISKFYAVSLLAMGMFYYLPLFLWGDKLLTWYIGGEFSSVASPILNIMVGSSLLYLLFNVIEANFYAKGAAAMVLPAYVFGVLTLVCALPLFVKMYGIAGAAWSVMLMFVVMLLSVLIGLFVMRMRVKKCPSL